MNLEETEKNLLELLKSGTGNDLYRFQRDCLSELDPRIIDRLLEVGTGWELYWFQSYCLSEPDPRILDRLLEIGTGHDIRELVYYLSGFEEPKL